MNNTFTQIPILVPYWSISGFHFLQEVHRCLQHYPRIPQHKLNAISALGKPRHRVSLIDDGQRRSVVLPFLAKFCRQLRIRRSCNLLNAADWTLGEVKKNYMVLVLGLQLLPRARYIFYLFSPLFPFPNHKESHRVWLKDEVSYSYNTF